VATALTQLRDRLWLLPLALAAIYVIALALTASSVIDAVYASADHSSNMFVVQALSSAPSGRTVVLGNIWWVEAMLFQLATRHLPAYRTLWEIAPWVSSMAAIAAASWAVLRVADRWAALLVGLTLACSGAQLLPLQFAWNTHALAYANACLLSAFTVVLVGRGGRLAANTVAWALLLGLAALVFGLGLASDSLFEWTGIAPFAIASVAVAWRGPKAIARPMLVSCATVVVGTIAISELTQAVMRSQGLVSSLIPIHLSAADKLLPHLGLLIQSIPVLMNGSLTAVSPTATGAVSLLCTVVILLGTGLALFVAGRSIGRLLRRRDAALASPEDTRARARAALIVYWAAGAVILAVAFVFSNLAFDITRDRYLVTVVYAVVVIAAIGTSDSWRARAASTIGAAILIAASAVAIARHYIPTQQYSLFPDRTEATGLEQFAAAHHLRYGYAAYWDAAPLTWFTNQRLEVYPTRGCRHHTLCPYGRPRISSWYTPRPSTRTFLLVDRRLIAGGKSDSLGVLGPPRAFGPPMSSTRIGEMTVYVYGYDIAARFGRPINP